ncbi:MAG: ribonuclease J [Alphaproteobacteria bacterium]|nr:ribonuclease J [Alphaproteobacteria bacterium]MCB9929433.1 ribonuclease J [Alphaproteobacteria bacterium]
MAPSKDNVLAKLPVPGKDEVLFCALGGIGEIGMNAALYGHDGQWIMVDCGITFADDQNPGVDVIVPDIRPARALGDRLQAIVITHAHEDHVGAVPYVGPGLDVPVYATPFTAMFLKRKLQEDGDGDVAVRTVDKGGSFQVGVFKLSYLPVAHSIPEAQSVAIETGIGTILHTGDWKTDPTPVVGKGFQPKRFEKLGEAGVLAMFCDSTNALVEGRTGSEAELAPGIAQQIAEAPGRIIFTSFASNVARMVTICRAAAEQGRHVGLAGRSLRRMHDIAKATGYWPDDLPALVDEADLGYLPPETTVILCTGSQGEANAALARMAGGAHQHITLGKGDTVVYSSRDIPGNERAIGRVRNRLLALGVRVVTERQAHIHVSGHPARDELRDMYGWVKPSLVVPCHGETAHLLANAELATACGVPAVAQAPDGIVLRIKKDHATELGRLQTGRQAVDGSRTVAIGGDTLRDRRKVMENGAVLISAALDRDGDLVADLEISTHGLTDGDDEELLDDIADVVEETLEETGNRDVDARADKVRTAVRRFLRHRFNKRPVVTVHLLRVDATVVA